MQNGCHMTLVRLKSYHLPIGQFFLSTFQHGYNQKWHPGRVRRGIHKYYAPGQQLMSWRKWRSPCHHCTPISSTGNLSRSNTNNGKDSGGGMARGGWEVTIIIANLTVGPDGCRGQAIYIRWGGASQEEALTYCGRQSPPQKEFLKAGKVMKTRKYWPGTVSLCEIWQFQKSAELLIQKLPFLWLVHEMALEVGKYDLHFQGCTIICLQEAAEAYIVGIMEDANLHVIHT